MKPGRIELSSRMNTAELTRALENRGVLRVDENSSYEKNGVKHVFLRERTMLEAVKDFFTLDKEALKAPALEARNAIASVVEGRVNAGQFLKNIQNRIEHKGHFSGRSIARDLNNENRSDSGKIMPLEGGNAVAESVGMGVHILEKNPLEISSTCTIVRSSSLPEELSKLAPTNSTSFDYAFIPPKPVITANLVVFKDIPMVADKNWKAHVAKFEEDLKTVLQYVSSIGGAIVIEVSPAMFQTGETGISPSRQRSLFAAMTKTVNQSMEEAKKKNQQIAITFAGEDKQMLAVFKSFYDADRLGLNKMDEASDQEDLSDSEDDDNEPVILDQSFVRATLARQLAENAGLDDSIAQPKIKKADDRLMLKDPMALKADHAIIRSSTVRTAIQKNPESKIAPALFNSEMTMLELKRNNDSVQGGLSEQFHIRDPKLATPSVTVLPDLQAVGIDSELPSIDANPLLRMYMAALDKKIGTVVLEPFPDQLVRDENGTSLIYSDMGLDMMMQAIEDAEREATQQGKTLKVQIASEDADLLARLRAR
jgi:hypothetical protein